MGIHKDLTGLNFGELRVLHFHHRNKHNQIMWLCHCSCGNYKSLTTSDLTRGTKSCGCLRKGTNKNSNHPNHRKGNKSPYWKGFGEISAHHWRKICDGAKERNIEISISIEDAWNLFLKQDRKCVLSGLSLEFRKTAKDKTHTASLDRIDSSKPYEKDNIQWIHKRINIMKMDMSEKDFIEFCKLIVERNCGNKKES